MVLEKNVQRKLKFTEQHGRSHAIVELTATILTNFVVKTEQVLHKLLRG